MMFWCRIKQSQLRALSTQFKFSYFSTKTPSLLNHTFPITSRAICAFENQSWFLSKNPSQFGNNFRFFAAPVQVYPKQGTRNADGQRLNEEITGYYIRLVTDEGHSVVPRHEALQRARTLKLDLVEVHRGGDPPVCKIMDYHREKYKKRLKAKELAKSKSELRLRKGAPKEVRITGKIEQKDLQMKANTVERLMERGYRVKCMAVGTEEEDLGGLLSRLTPLIEDFSLVESGPAVERRQAYVIVRHIKYGPSKKGTKQKKIIVPPSTFNSSTETSSSSEEVLNAEESDVGSIEDSLSESEDTLSESEEESPALENRYKTQPVNRYNTGPANSVPPTGQMNANRSDLRNSVRLDPLSMTDEKPPAPENRYKTGPTNRYRTGQENRVAPTREMNGNRPDLRNSTRTELPFQNQDRQRQFDLNTPFPSRNHANEFPGSPRSSYGSFSTPEAHTDPQRQSRPAEINRYKRGPNPNSPPSDLQGDRRPFVGQRSPGMSQPQNSNESRRGSTNNRDDERR